MVKRYRPNWNAGTNSHGVHDAVDGDYVRYSDYAALEAQLAERVKVKQLEWDCRQADTAIGTYRINVFTSGVIVLLDGAIIPGGRGFVSESEAKTAAQADYERRILSAFASHPRDTNQVVSHEAANMRDKLSALEATPPAPPGWSRVTEDDGAKYLNPPDDWLNTELTTPPAPKVTATTDHDPKLGTTLRLMKQSWGSRQPTNSGAPKVKEAIREFVAKQSSTDYDIQAAISDRSDIYLTAAQEAGKP